MSIWFEFACGAASLELLQRDARDKVRWTATPFVEGELEKARINRAFTELRTLSYAVVRATWFGNCGPYQYPHVHNAWLECLKRRAQEFERTATPEQIALAPWMLFVNIPPIEIKPRAAYSIPVTTPAHLQITKRRA
jgi:hypothetical protein